MCVPLFQLSAEPFSPPTSWRSWRKLLTRLTIRMYMPERCSPWRRSCQRTGYRSVFNLGCTAVCAAMQKCKVCMLNQLPTINAFNISHIALKSSLSRIWRQQDRSPLHQKLFSYFTHCKCLPPIECCDRLQHPPQPSWGKAVRKMNEWMNTLEAWNSVVFSIFSLSIAVSGEAFYIKICKNPSSTILYIFHQNFTRSHSTCLK